MKKIMKTLFFLVIVMSFKVQAAPNCKDLSLRDKKTATPGFTCISSKGATFQVLQEIGPKKEKVWLDADRSMMFFVYYKGINLLSVANQACAQLPTSDGVPWTLATGYLPSENAKFGNRDSDILALDADAATEVMTLTKEQWFWLKDPKSPYYESITLNSSSGRRVVYNYGGDDDTYGAVCVKMLINP